MTICFRTPGLIDLRALRTFGVSAKGSVSAIGQFGTGLKYAIAVALRHNCQVEIWRGLDQTRFYTQKDLFRDKEFSWVFMDGADADHMELPFTTELGKHWQPWMAFRELESNTRDESGETFLVEGETPQREGMTCILVTGMDQEYHGRHRTFMLPSIITTCGDLEIHKGTSAAIYCKGVRVLDLKESAEFTYNFTNLELTEDRTAKSEHAVFWNIGDRLQDHCHNQELLYAIMCNGAGSMEGMEIEWPCATSGLTDEFVAALTQLVNEDRLKYINPHLRTLWSTIKPKKIVGRRPPRGRETILIDRATAFLRRCGLADCDYLIEVASELPDHALGIAEAGDSRITLSEKVLQQGLKQVAATIFEEWLHLRTGLKDETYEMQNHLFNLILTQAEMRTGEVL